MNAIKVKATETNSSFVTKHILFPIKPEATEIKHEAKEINILPFTNTPNASIRSSKAREYIRNNRIRKQKRDDIISVVLGSIILIPWALLLFL